MSTEEGKKKPQGFAAFSEEKLHEAASKGGSRKVPKGFATMPEEWRKTNASKAAKIRWESIRAKELEDESDAQRQDNRKS